MKPATQPESVADAIRAAIAALEPWQEQNCGGIACDNPDCPVCLLRAALARAEALEALYKAAHRAVLIQESESREDPMSGLRAAFRKIAS